ncbi:hypothetical protein CDD82_997 [Ophiocordyceps australis]|uniref:ribonuclease T2 n=1 Tax=Ophiocordyceps australis TaxID=1399860 RepID=A0A2C5ZMV3_9HYPO|nr:hypothetical protein CDD82_997 [Ophiocordyceps australis]
MHCSLLSALATCFVVNALLTAQHSPSCASDEPILSCSCEAIPSVDSCCTETRGGLVVATQIWDTFTGLESRRQIYPRDAWTIHGLWPDFCNGSYTQYCDLSRQFDPKPSPNTTTGTPQGLPVPPYTGEPIDGWFEPHGKTDLLRYMEQYWVSQGDPNWVFWAHEYSKHATCFSTFDTQCYNSGAVAQHSDLFSFFETAVAFHQALPTFSWLSDAGITPSNTTTYSLSHLQRALSVGFGLVPFVGCSGPRYNETDAGKGSADDGRTRLSEVWYFYHVYGRPQNVESVKLAADTAGGRLSSCAMTEGAVWYFERAAGSER